MMNGPGTIRRRRRSSSISAAAIEVALVAASATGSSQERISRRCGGVSSANPNPSRTASSCW
jgi:hypothetical protein